MKRQRTELVYLPDDCWERVFRFVNEDGDEEDNNCRHYLNSISLVSKQFLSISNRHKLCLTDSAFFALVRNCPSLTEIAMESTCIEENTAAQNNSMDSVVYPQFKSLS
ncbi:F-box/LRR-repeat protein [Trifolium pratense]|uniref:F-box/LRR-repeat protein n=1 Tax=Trifolium pratense TaxID=57577 RepID=A0A2K3L056_TRIPR|nr:F-box/LRR-repeat protein [Trifolium pratense]